tara:strand:- start:1823 stop:2359 length:537 start_codon:yes stop_codon:yes gene_type:complete
MEDITMSDNTETNATVSEEVSTGTEVNSPDTESPLAYENKKYRQRAQEAEKRLTELEKKLASAEEAKLKEKEDFKALYEKVSSENEALDATAQKWNKYEENRRNTLLESAPEEDRERLSGLDLDTLEYVTGKINNEKPNMPEVVGRTRNVQPQKPYSSMTEDERRLNWADIVKQAKLR